MNRRVIVWLSCFTLALALCWHNTACAPEEVKNKEKTGESGGTVDAGEKPTEPKDGGGTTDTGTTDTGTQDNGTQDNGTQDSGPGQDNAGADTPSGNDNAPDLTAVDNTTSNPIKITFTPKDGSEIEVKDFCANVEFSQEPKKKGWSAKWQAQGKTEQVPAALQFDSNDATKAKLCALVYLEQNTTYNIELTVKDQSESTLSTGKVSYKTKAPYTNEKPAEPGITTGMSLTQLVSPAGLAALLGGLKPEQLVPILAHLHTKDSGNQGNLIYIGAAGKAAPGQKPHQGKDRVDNAEPSSALLQGKFSGRWFSVGSPNFFFSAGNLSLTLEQFQLTGITSTDGKRIEEGSFTAVIDSAPVKKQFGLDICLLLVGECFKGPNGRVLIRFAGKLKGVANPLTFSAFLPKPIRLSTGVNTTPKVEFYFTEAVSAATDISLKWESCTGSGDPQTPCDTSKGAKINVINVQGNTTLGTNKREGTFTPSQALPTATWIRLTLSAKSSNNTTTSSFTLFQTK